MSRFRQIKVLYSIRILIFTYIIWSLITDVIFGIFIDYRLFLISIGAVFIMQFLKVRENRTWVIFSVPWAASFIIFYIINPNNFKYLLLSLIYIVFAVFLLYKIEDEGINYDTYAYRAQRAIYSLCILGLWIALRSNYELKLTLERLMLFYLIMIIVTLRESRQYQYEIKGRHDLLSNAAAAALIILLSMDRVFKFISYILGAVTKSIANVVLHLLYIFLKFLVYLLGYPLEKLIQAIVNFVSQRLLQNHAVNLEVNNSNNVDLQNLLPEKGLSVPENVKFAIGIMVLLFIIYMIIRIVRFENSVKENRNDKEIIERESIFNVSKKDRKNLLKAFRKYILPGDIRGQINAVYREFEKKLSKAGIFKNHMTASQLSNVASVNVKDRNSLMVIKDIYNEGKFSDHKMKREQLEEMKINFNKIKKEL